MVSWTANLESALSYLVVVGMGLMLATIWIRLGTSTDKINDRLSVLYVDLPSSPGLI